MTADDLILLGRVLANEWDGVDPERAYGLLYGLQASLPRLIEAARSRRPPPAPTWVCSRCGAVEYFRGNFSRALFERMADEFHRAHRACPLAIDGGGI